MLDSLLAPYWLCVCSTCRWSSLTLYAFHSIMPSPVSTWILHSAGSCPYYSLGAHSHSSSSPPHTSSSHMAATIVHCSKLLRLYRSVSLDSLGILTMRYHVLIAHGQAFDILEITMPLIPSIRPVPPVRSLGATNPRVLIFS